MYTKTDNENVLYNKTSWKQHRGRKIWTNQILNGETLDRCSYRCPLCISISSSGALLPADFSHGVDRVTVRIPLVEELCEPTTFFSHMKDTESGALEGNWKHPLGPNIHCRLDKTNVALLVDFNPSRIFDIDGTKLCPASLVSPTVKAVLEELIELGGILPVFAMSEDRQEFLEKWENAWESEVGIIRLDVARDFHLPPELFSTEWYKDVKPKNSRASVGWRNDGEIETLSGQFGKKTGAPKFYNKHKQCVKENVVIPAPPGTFRFEQVLRWKQLNTNHIHALDQINENSVQMAMHKFWDKSRLGEPVIPTHGWLDYFLECDAPVDLQCQAIAHFKAKEAGKILNLNTQQIKDVETLARAQSYKLNLPASKQSPIRYRLDLDSGHMFEITAKGEQEIIPGAIEINDANQPAA